MKILFSNIKSLSYNYPNKTVKDASCSFWNKDCCVNNYNDAINEITKEENGKCPYYACWTLNSNKEQNKTKEFLELLVIFWINGGAVILLSDNDPFTTETNLFLSIISAGFTMKDHILDKKK